MSSDEIVDGGASADKRATSAPVGDAQSSAAPVRDAATGDETTGDEAVREHGVPHRDLRDPAALRALAHPVRLSILEQLMQLGSGTATELAELLEGESPANCSWHLRQLARYGFVEVAGTGPGRQRRWKPVIESTTFGGSDETPALARAVDAVDEVILDREVERMQAWRRARRDETDRWRDGSVEAYAWAWMTAEELAAFKDDFRALIERHIMPRLEQRADPARRPRGARPVRLVTWLIPTGPDDDAADDDAADDDAGDGDARDGDGEEESNGR
ncbi:winged helix-turn-helix domain-containing protein [Phytoactinopolyspora halotolerans]|uniref:Helix-turn-helix transcriptional regulator n=1 Tax=Phytoactinopolyspora halotolerans TaxID=1981512 RepID=A0A6L9SBG9_9ACTN|nr:helix-turn-helix domain-containing protein [Phytoactinopolyspora halotolerans]NEE02403.1 helix-turn-helix transcriptional regulator [Phytoactinopolyspora halotolerans]